MRVWDLGNRNLFGDSARGERGLFSLVNFCEGG